MIEIGFWCLFVYLLLGWDSCNTLLRSGYFVNDEWQPRGCALHQYTAKYTYRNLPQFLQIIWTMKMLQFFSEVSACTLSESINESDLRVSFVGDSRIRQQYYSFISAFSPSNHNRSAAVHSNLHFHQENPEINVVRVTWFKAQFLNFFNRLHFKIAYRWTLLSGLHLDASTQQVFHRFLWITMQFESWWISEAFCSNWKWNGS